MTTSSDNAGLILGPFVIEKRIGEGAMGEVWRGRHVAQDVPVALKVLTRQSVMNRRYREAFAHEVRAVARVGHPGIALVFDHGNLPESVAIASRGELMGGCPYMVMEWAAGGTLTERRPNSWDELSDQLTQVLRALGHAHARGLIHRDIKPGNILVTSADRNAPPLLKLADFGLAFASDGGTDLFEGSAMGTPEYMAPEQIRGRWRELGPWTDLFAVGVLGWYLACGRTPFSRREMAVEEVFRAQLHAPLPEFQPIFNVSLEYEAWLRRLMHRSPGGRFVWAADAERALNALPRPDDDGVLARGGQRPPTSLPTVGVGVWRSEGASRLGTESGGGRPVTVAGRPESVAAAPIAHGEKTVLSEPMAEVVADAPRAVDDTESTPVPFPLLPIDWRTTGEALLPMALIGVGLGLFGLRTPPLCGREAERDQLWSGFVSIYAHRKPAFIELQGPAGTGKSRLAEWLVQRVEEGGFATAMRATHAPLLGRSDGIVAMIKRHAGAHGLDGDELFACLDDSIGELESAAGSVRGININHLCDALERRALSEGRELGRRERFAELARYLHLVCDLRALVLWIDDAQWGLDALEFVATLMESDLPILVVATTRSDLLGAHPHADALLSRMQSLDSASRLTVDTLDASAHRDLVGNLLGLTGELADEVCVRTAGNPLFAIQLIGDWVDRGVLEVTDDGFELAEGEVATLPGDVHALWLQRVDAAFTELDAGAAATLECAAALGLAVDAEEWEAVAEALHSAQPEVYARFDGSLREHTSAYNLMIPRDGAWVFCHGLLRESLRRRSHREGRWSALNQACAETLAGRLEGGDAAARIGRHWHEAGEHLRAFDILLEAADGHARRGEITEGLDLLESAEAALAELSEIEQRTRRPVAKTFRARLWTSTGRLEEARGLTEVAIEEAAPLVDRRILAEAMNARGVVLQRLGNLDEARASYAEAETLFAASDDVLGRATALCGVGEADFNLGRVDDAIASMRLAHAIAIDAGESRRIGVSASSLGIFLVERREFDDARSFLRMALEIHEGRGDRFLCANTWLNLGELERKLGEHETAVACYQEALELMLSVAPRNVNVGILHTNIALAHHAAGEDTLALLALERAEELFESCGVRALLTAVAVIRLPCLASTEGGAAIGHALSAAEELMAARTVVFEDLALAASEAAELCANDSVHDFAVRAAQLAVQQFRGIGQAEEAESVSTRFIDTH